MHYKLVCLFTFSSAVCLLFPEKAVQVALDETSEEDTLIVLTGDHSHGITINGYPRRGNNILGAYSQWFQTTNFSAES